VGYGDSVPTTPASKIFAVFVVFLGVGAITLVAAGIASAWIATEERNIEREILADLHKQLGAVHAELAALRAALPQDPAAGATEAGRDTQGQQPGRLPPPG
jgi:voltage-gated potassium channel